MWDMHLQTPEYLWLALALLPLAVWDGLRRWPGRRSRQLGAVGLRVAMLGALILALAQPLFSRSAPRQDVIFVLDVSASIDDDALHTATHRVDALRDDLGAEDRPGLVTVDADARVVAWPGQPWPAGWDTPAALRGHGRAPYNTDLAAALRLAAGAIEPGAAGQIVLLTDGRATLGDLDRATGDLVARGLRVSTVTIEGGRREAVISNLELSPSQLRPGESLTGSVELSGGREAMTGKLVARVGESVIAEQDVTVPAGASITVPLKHALDPDAVPGTLPVRVTVELPGQYLRSEASLVVLGTPRVLLVAQDADTVSPLARALTAEGMTPRIVDLGGLDLAASELDSVDLVVLADVPAEATEPGQPAMSPAFIARLRKYVSGGGGLVVLGGEHAYDLGGYGKTELRTFLPVELDPEDPEVSQAVTMIIILDRSGSMGEWVPGGGTKMDLTNQGAVAAMRLLRPFDNIGVMSVDEYVNWRVPTQAATITPEMERAVRGIYADGGGIFCYTALVEAWRVLKLVDTPLKHVILFSDAADAEEQVRGVEIGWGPGPNSYQLAESMVKDGITVSVIGVGTSHDTDTPFLRNLASHGNGRFHISANARKLISLFVEETQQLLQLKLHEDPFTPTVKIPHPVLDGIDLAKAPKLRGYVELEPRQTAEVWLTGPEDHPIITSWQYGLGQVVAVATDAGPRWAGDWLTWEGYSRFWTQLARWALKHREGDDTGIQVSFEGNETILRVARRQSTGTTTDQAGLRALLRPRAGASAAPDAWRPVDLDAVEPGLWEARLDLDPETSYDVGLVDADNEPVLSRTFAAPPSRELRYTAPDTDRLRLLAEQTGGAVDVVSLPPSSPGQSRESTPLWLFLVAGGAFMLPLDAMLRRPAREV